MLCCVVLGRVGPCRVGSGLGRLGWAVLGKVAQVGLVGGTTKPRSPKKASLPVLEKGGGE